MIDREYSEKRDYIRMFVNADLEFKVNQGTETFTGKSKNLSGKGLGFNTQCELKDGDILELKLTADEAKVAPLELTVKVVRVEAGNNDGYFIATETQ